MSPTSRHEKILFPPRPQLNLSICNGRVLIRAAQYTVHHREILHCRPRTVRAQEVDSMHSNMEKVLSVSEFISPVSFYCKSPSSYALWLSSTTCTILDSIRPQMYSLYIRNEVLYVPPPINLWLVDVRGLWRWNEIWWADQHPVSSARSLASGAHPPTSKRMKEKSAKKKKKCRYL